MRVVAWSMFACVIVCGCDRAVDSPAAPPRVRVDEVKGRSTVRGRVRFEGTPPVMQAIANRPCHDAAEPITEEHVLVGSGGGLKNVFVYVESSALPAVNGAALEPAVLDQVNCQYVPHVIGVCVGQSLRIRSSDRKTMHNVHYTPQRNESRNFGMTDAGQEKSVAFTAPEFIRARCDVHPWMTAWIGVFDTPFFAVTDDDGQFEISNLPAGDYTIRTWHERYGSLEAKANATETPTDIQLTYKSPVTNNK